MWKALLKTIIIFQLNLSLAQPCLIQIYSSSIISIKILLRGNRERQFQEHLPYSTKHELS